MHSNIINTLTFRININLFSVYLIDRHQVTILLYVCLFLFFVFFVVVFFLNFGLS